ncbi:uncharacterized protein BO66DRAFT_247660 [Aspergillus aculeatinus CBS 121060]|uniref:Uncharacterized protein n=1 Tax=Aspergillus aculeatinus CBS 121060 TaxID=1448322 RepID=A0ACD1GSA5_9EURO|nr:hypothetical protein BO66DRAFT_247660 [Aspergillus aculeatinus CBS 121060]RAH64163.1 hypothetical protein BO66DRAFT_247660 [Aspergillus aculeatinus CBS 121060]
MWQSVYLHVFTLEGCDSDDVHQCRQKMTCSCVTGMPGRCMQWFKARFSKRKLHPTGLPCCLRPNPLVPYEATTITIHPSIRDSSINSKRRFLFSLDHCHNSARHLTDPAGFHCLAHI